MNDRLIRITTALAVVAVAAVAAVISYRHAYELVHSHGESGPTARLVPFTVDGLIWAASMVILDASRRKHPAPPLAKWSLAVGIVATVGANVAHGATHGLIGAIVSAWPALALVGSFELLMTLTRSAARGDLAQDEERTKVEQTPEQAVRDEYRESLNGPGRPVSQRYLAEKYGIDRRKVKQIITSTEQPAPA
ncbi:DUF2637 domain-containing protein [Actinomadura citrea]|uniref:DUF2637 domain-containing protein n=1 Tax=Actinomadura citrea TaxID=46158 RepID=A0A7Y9G964_9ACTN|nr:DUF2637 domain-containing protein [Actinomadura citrea]NYE12191.1 hypothetical protein [Actinomadura citrea]GGT50177.1 hypothetical protein GCM10010177_02460 [Actinomadura citrea]